MIELIVPSSTSWALKVTVIIESFGFFILPCNEKGRMRSITHEH